MKNLRRRRILFISAAAVATLGVILWSAYVFTAIWLRVRCARELALRAEPLDEVRLGNQTNAEHRGLDTFVLDGNLAMFGLINWTGGSDPLDRLESLQRPSIGTVFQLLLGWERRDEVQGLDLTQTIVLNRQARYLAVPDGSVGLELSEGQSNTLAATTLRVLATNPPTSVGAGQTLANIVLWQSDQAIHCHSVTDSDGDQLLLVTRPVHQEEGDPADPPVSGLEITVIDSAGRILDRSRLPRGRLLGKLTDRRGKADQLVFGTPGWATNPDGTSQLTVIGPGVVCIIEAGRLKAIQTIDPPNPSEGAP